MKRKKILQIYVPLVFCFGLIIFFSLKNYSKKNFSTEKLNQLINTVSLKRDVTDDLCKYQILSEPKVGDNYIKINFWCKKSTQARSTLSLAAITDNSTFSGVLKEYARIINFDYNLISKNNWYCLFNDEEIVDFDQPIRQAGTIDCFENKDLYRYDQKNL